MDQRQQRPIEEGVEQRGAPVERGPERGLRLVQLPAHARVLRALTREQERYGGRTARATPDRDPGSRPAVRDAQQTVAELSCRIADDRERLRMRRPADVRGECDVLDRD